MGGSAITQANRDPILGRVAGADGLKTGHTDEAGYGFTGSAEQNGRRLVMVVAGLTSVGPARRGIGAVHGVGLPRVAVEADRREGQARSRPQRSSWATPSTVGLVAPKALTVTLPAGTSPNLTAKVVYDGPIKAPIKAGQHIADLVVTTSDGLPAAHAAGRRQGRRRRRLLRSRLGRPDRRSSGDDAGADA